jgi:hypothetical protein
LLIQSSLWYYQMNESTMHDPSLVKLVIRNKVLVSNSCTAELYHLGHCKIHKGKNALRL